MRDLTNQIFGKWRVLKYDGFRYYCNHKRHYWLCECQCEYKTLKSIMTSQLINSQTNSCRKCVNKKFNIYDLSGEYGIGYLECSYKFYFDLEDYDKINNYCWHKHKDGYLRTKVGESDNGGNIYSLQHRFILDCNDSKFEVDHINRKRFDNRKTNLILVNHNENMKNYGKYKSNKSGIIGVYYNVIEKAWKSYIQFNNKKMNLGTFSNIEEAATARLKKEKELYDSINKKPPQIHLFEKYNID